DWVQKTYDVSAYAGRRVRVMFWVNPGGYYLNVHLDNVSLQVTVPSPGLTNDVFFGTNPTPGAAEYQGSTANSTWPLPQLAPLTTYYWQIVAHHGGVGAGPVWQFTTAGVDHFAWNPISSPQTVNGPFSATLQAVDAFGSTVSNYTGVVSFHIGSGTGGTIEDFESGTWPRAPWTSAVAGATVGTISSAFAHDGNYGL